METIEPPGHGDGNEIEPGVYRVTTWPNVSHPHLGGDFIYRDKDGESILMSFEKWEMICKGVQGHRRPFGNWGQF